MPPELLALFACCDNGDKAVLGNVVHYCSFYQLWNSEGVWERTEHASNSPASSRPRKGSSERRRRSDHAHRRLVHTCCWPWRLNPHKDIFSAKHILGFGVDLLVYVVEREFEAVLAATPLAVDEVRGGVKVL